jgi:hypothetical protein
MVHYKEIIQIFHDEHKLDGISEDLEITAKAITAMIIANHDNIQISAWDENSSLKNNTIYNIYDFNNDNSEIILNKIQNSFRRVDINRGGELPITATSFFLIKLKDFKWKIPFSRAVWREGAVSIVMPVYPHSFDLPNNCCLNLDEIESVDIVIMSSLRSFKREIVRKKKAVANLEESISNLFDEDLV